MNYEFLLLLFMATVPAYLLGSTNGAIITSKLFYRKDIREYGSGNPGLTNFYRVFGKAGTILVVFIDVIKTVIPVLFGGWLFAHFLNMMQSTNFPFGYFISASFFGQAISGFAVMMGHCFPLFYKFKGGKGVMAIGAIVIVIDWRLAIISWSMFIIVTAVTRYVSLGAILSCIAFPISMAVMNIGGIAEFGIAELNVVILCVLLVFARHIPNIKRLIKGEESKLNLKRKKE